MSKPGADPSPGISLGDALRLPKRHPACRRREAQSGSRTERENLAGDVKGKGASGSNREAEGTSLMSALASCGHGGAADERDEAALSNAVSVVPPELGPFFLRVQRRLQQIQQR
jgi:hypothetical protein